MRRLIIIHYHLNPGGVTRIVESQIQCLKEQNAAYEIVVMCGEVANPQSIEKLGAKLIVNPRLNYLADNLNDYRDRLATLQQFLNKNIRPDDIIHFHNMNLGKNPLLTIAITQLAAQGYKVLNHAHDFAEDRPDNMTFLRKLIEEEFELEAGKILYPDFPNYLYATLNSFDKNRLLGYGVEAGRTFLLPNPVVLSQSVPSHDTSELKNKVCADLDIDAEKLLITYPVRVIRRKNIAEYILLCCLYKQVANWVVTQPPKNPQEIVHYKAWKEFCEQEGIPVIFEAGLKTGFEELIQASNWCFTTSIREGFGMVYMEPWLMNTPVGGRNLDYITSDLTGSGMQFPLLYNQLIVEHEGRKQDFAELQVDEQKDFIRNLINSEDAAKTIFELNPVLQMITKPVSDEVIAHNQSIILTEYSLSTYAKRIEGIYRKLAG